ncbi:MAG: hypothetical protein AAFP86_07700 [Planctomycetota bacterium]
MKELSVSATRAKNTLRQPTPWAWMVTISMLEIGTQPYQQLRLTSFESQVTRGAADDGSPLVFYPAPLTIDGLRETSEGDLPQISIGVGVAGPGVLELIDARNGLARNPVLVELVHGTELITPGAGIAFEGVVTGCSVSSSAVSIKVSSPNLTRSQFPRQVYRRVGCGHVFGDGLCGYDRSAPGALFQTCPRTLTACIERGEDEKARGLGDKHPRNFFAFPGMARR